MCIISIIMIALCIPNQIQVANAAAGDTETSFRIWDKNGDWSENKTNSLELFPNDTSRTYDIQPGDHRDYTFNIENDLGYKVNYEIRLEATIEEKVQGEETDTTYPIKYQLYNRTKNESINVLGSGWKNPFDYLDDTIIYKEKGVSNGTKNEYVLRWMFEEVDSLFKGGNYNLILKVNVERALDSDDNTTPTNPDDDKKDDNKGDNNNSTDNGNSGNNSSNNNGSNNGNNTSNNNKGNNTNDGTSGNDSSNNNQNNKDNLNIDKTSSKGTGSIETNKKKVNTSDITTPVIYVALMILMFGLILLVKSRKEN